MHRWIAPCSPSRADHLKAHHHLLLNRKLTSDRAGVKLNGDYELDVRSDSDLGRITPCQAVEPN